MAGLTFAVAEPSDMVELGQQLGKQLAPGDVVSLTGPLGAGKTTLVRGVAAGLDVSDQVSSPTFVIARQHAGRVPLQHVDAYRISDEAEFDDLDLEARDQVTVIEWGEPYAALLTDAWLELALARTHDSEVRTVAIVTHGWPAQRVAALSAALRHARGERC